MVVGTINQLTLNDGVGGSNSYSFATTAENVTYGNTNVNAKINTIEGQIAEIAAVTVDLTPSKIGFIYGTCSTIASETIKVVNASSTFEPKNFGIISVAFDYGVPADSQLKVNNVTTYIKYQGSNIRAGIIEAGDTATFIYTGYFFVLIAIDKVKNFTLKKFQKNTSLNYGDSRSISLDMTNYTYNANDVISVYINGLFGVEGTDWTLNASSTPPTITISATGSSGVSEQINIVVLKMEG